MISARLKTGSVLSVVFVLAFGSVVPAVIATTVSQDALHDRLTDCDVGTTMPVSAYILAWVAVVVAFGAVVLAAAVQPRTSRALFASMGIGGAVLLGIAIASEALALLAAGVLAVGSGIAGLGLTGRVDQQRQRRTKSALAALLFSVLALCFAAFVLYTVYDDAVARQSICFG